MILALFFQYIPLELKDLLRPTLGDLGLFTCDTFSESRCTSRARRGESLGVADLRSPIKGELGALRDLKYLASGGGT